MLNFAKDIRVEKEIGSVLDRDLYNENFKRVKNKELQKKGVDVIYEKGIKKIHIDEKCAAHYFPKNKNPLHSFAFELENFNSGNTGWFLREDLKTDCYNLIWGNAECNNFNDITADNIIDMELYFIIKDKLKTKLTKMGITNSFLRNSLEKIKENYRYSKDYKKFYIQFDSNNKPYISDNPLNSFKEVSFSYSGYYHERPLNLVIDKRILKKVASFIFEMDSSKNLKKVK